MHQCPKAGVNLAFKTVREFTASCQNFHAYCYKWLVEGIILLEPKLKVLQASFKLDWPTLSAIGSLNLF
jgi:hypothetical protein